MSPCWRVRAGRRKSHAARKGVERCNPSQTPPRRGKQVTQGWPSRSHASTSWRSGVCIGLITDQSSDYARHLRKSLIEQCSCETECLFRVLCHEHHRSTRRCATVREMKEGPSGSAIRSLIPSHRKLLSSKAMVVNVAEKSGQDSGRQG